MIILIRHAQSEGNKNRDIHQFIPDHRVKLTQDGQQQAEEAGGRLRSLLRPDDTLHFYTSPYRRTRETTEGILKSLTSDEPKPSPFPRHKIRVYEEPRLREQDFGNFQPCSAEMERMWQERADYGHFFYRIPNGESAADAYDRISGFNESLWRQFGEDDFPSVCVLVTHGMMTRVFLMKWYHWSVEYFEDLRNVNHCEFVVMKQNANNGKFILENEMRTWSDLKKRAAAASSSTSPSKGPPLPFGESASVPIRQWGGCVNGCNHAQINYPRKNQPRRQNTADLTQAVVSASRSPEKDKEASIAEEPSTKLPIKAASLVPINKPSVQHDTMNENSTTDAETPSQTETDADASGSSSDVDERASPSPTQSSQSQGPRQGQSHALLNPARYSSGIKSASSNEGFFSEDSDYFPKRQNTQRSIATVFPNEKQNGRQRPPSRSSSAKRRTSVREKKEKAKTEAGWKVESGMGKGARADELGDGDAETETADTGQETTDALEEAKIQDRKSFSEVY
ncbi:phosphoglycerate mutase-like protein [Pseudovirgaria hyperparasitica]|uniref:Phosphoglycerate mutase-like protein n=1 Tax=Pseudovirgaria hyperparasitica TaxID=470096 RepID=A0A6A6WJJ4_9PEZI|nr:phosphoglycerate mutase-like protein [Pseudovirgaria hyperparasitica]KAF2762444.1 phosphoglycerate mutase-like protein [Pseudovirgaria hyperparasitica]